MTNTLIAVLASAGLMTAGVAATATQTRSASAMTAAKVSAPVAGSSMRASREAARPDCTLPSNSQLPECVAPGRSGEVLGGTTAAHGGVSGVVLGVLAVGAIGGAVAIAAKSDSKG